jgi:DNA-binding CsgD family transcriptional regulator
MVAAAENWIARFSRRIPDYPSATSPLQHAFDLMSPLGPSPVLVDSLWQLSSIPQISGRLDEAAGIAREALDMARTIGYLTGEAYACLALAVIAIDGGDPDRGLAWAKTAHEIDAAQLTGDAHRWAAVFLALALEASGDMAQAGAVRIQGLDACRQAGDLNLVNSHLRNLAIIDIKSVRLDDARRHLLEAIDDGARRGDWWALLESFEAAAVWAVSHDPDAAAVLLGATRALAARIGYTYQGGFHEPDFTIQAAHDISQALGSERAHLAEQTGAAMPLTQTVDFARTALMAEAPRPGDTRTAGASNLTKRERELLALLAEGLTDNQIAEKLFISLRTVRSHLDRIRDKTGYRRRAELTRLAVSAQPTHASTSKDS